jgi:hypothetical protein
MSKLTRTITKTVLFAATLGGFALLAPDEAKADPNTHDGFYMSGDLGLGYLSTSAEAGGAEVEISGMSIPVAFLLGGTVGPVVIGGGFSWHTVPSPSYSFNGEEYPGDPDVTLRMIGIEMFADIYPDPHGGLHIQPAVGWGGLTAEAEGQSSSNDPTGLFLSLGVGYEFWMGEQFSLGPMFRFDYGMFAFEDVDYPTIAPSLLCSLTWH